eukprot:555805-Hanusia_phi.AAC.1
MVAPGPSIRHAMIRRQGPEVRVRHRTPVLNDSQCLAAAVPARAAVTRGAPPGGEQQEPPSDCRVSDRAIPKFTVRARAGPWHYRSGRVLLR